ncbi:MAG: HD domain-containing phosphohydrolase, partial [Pyrinomonadaceae bacterium]
IPLMARIVSVADTFDAMTTDRPYSRALKFDEAVKLVQSYVGTRYDETVVAALVDACESGQIRPGSVRLRWRQEEATATALPVVTPPAVVAAPIT